MQIRLPGNYEVMATAFEDFDHYRYPVSPDMIYEKFIEPYLGIYNEP